MNEAIGLSRILSKKELLSVPEDVNVVPARFKVFCPKSQNLSVTFDVARKIPKTRFRCRWMFRMIPHHPEHVVAQMHAIQCRFSIRGVIADQYQTFIDLLRILTECGFEFLRLRF